MKGIKQSVSDCHQSWAQSTASVQLITVTTGCLGKHFEGKFHANGLATIARHYD